MAILFVDNSGGVFRTELDTGRTERLADYSQTWTDIAVRPDGSIFAITFYDLYELDLDNGTATWIRSLSGTANGLASDDDGNLYVGSGFRGEGIDVLDAKSFAEIDSIPLTDSTYSAGDIHIQGDTLYYASGGSELLTVDLETRSVVDTSYHGIPALFGLQYEARTLYGLAGDDVYEIDPDSGEFELIYTLPISGSVNGAATLAGVTVEGTRREDTLIADVGGSTLMGLKGGDILIGSDAADTLIGGKGRDYLFGDGGRDKLKGDQGRDTLDGGRGKDTLIGGAGKDVFVFETGDGSVRIRDFEDDVDTIEIEAAMMGRGAKKIGRLLSDFGEIDGGDAVVDFGRKGEIRIDGVTDLSDLRDDILIY